MAFKNVSTTRPMGKSALRNVELRKQMALMLQKEGMEPLPSGNMAGRVFVPKSPFQGLAKVANVGAGVLGQYLAGKREKQIEADERSSFLEGIQNYNTAMQPVAGTAARAETNVIPPQGDKYSIHTGNPVYQPASGQYQAAQAEIPARERTKQEKIQEAINLMGSKNERLRRFGENRYAESLVPTKPIALSENDRLIDPLTKKVLLDSSKKPDVDKNVAEIQQLQTLIADPNTSDSDSKNYKNRLQHVTTRPSEIISTFTAKGVVLTDKATGISWLATDKDGNNVIGANQDTELQHKLAIEKAGGKVWGQLTTEAKAALPKTITQAEDANRFVDELLNHAGFKNAVGVGTRMVGAGFFPTDVADFQSRLEQLTNGAFLTAFEQLIGGGHITEIEGIKATGAINRMKDSTSEAEFKTAARDYLKIVNDGLRKAQGLSEQAPVGSYKKPSPTATFDQKAKTSGQGQSTVQPPPDGYEIIQ